MGGKLNETPDERCEVTAMALPGEVAAGGVILPTLRTLVLRLEDIEQAGGVLTPTVTGEE